MVPETPNITSPSLQYDAPNFGVTVEVWSDATAFEAREHEWAALERASIDPHTAFQSLTWCKSWCRTFAEAGSGHEIRVYAARRNGELVALLPLMLDRTGGVNVLTLLGEPHSQISNAVCAPGAGRAPELSAIFSAMEQEPGADLISLPRIPVSSPLVECFGKDAFRDDPARAMFLTGFEGLPDSEAFQANLSKNRRKDFRRKLRRLQELGTVRYEIHSAGSPAFTSLARKAVTMKKAWLREKGMVSNGLSRTGIEDFLAGISETDGGFSAELGCLSLDSAPIGFEFNISGKGTRHCYLSAYDPAYGEFSAGMLAHLHGIHASADSGFRYYNFLGYPSPFKAAWSNRQVELRAFVKPLTLKGRIFQDVWRDLARPGLKQGLNLMRGFTPGRVLARMTMQSGRR